MLGMASVGTTIQRLSTLARIFGALELERRKDWEVLGRHHAMMPLGFWDVRRFYFMIPWDVYYCERYD
jgi:hypothetical protein